MFINSFQKIVNIFSVNPDYKSKYGVDNSGFQRNESTILEKQDYILNKSLKHLEFISQLEVNITSDELRFFPQDFIHDLETNKLISKIDTLKTAKSMAIKAA